MAVVHTAENQEFLPIESTPEILTELARNIGIPAPWGISDVFGLDPDVLVMVPQPVGGLILLFPMTATPSRNAQNTSAPSSTIFLQQHDEASNACGFFALLHCAANTDGLKVITDSPLDTFLQQAQSLPDPDSRGRALIAADALRDLSNRAAIQGETNGAGSADNQNQHYVAFVCVENALLELDGRHLDTNGNAVPINHGPTTPESLISDAALLIQREYLSRDPSSHNFSLLAFCQLPSS